MKFDRIRRDGVKESVRSSCPKKEDHIVPYPTAGDFGLGGGGGNPFDDKKGGFGSYIDVRGGEKVGFEDAFSSSFDSRMDLGFSFGTGELQDWRLGMDPVPEFDGSKWSDCGMPMDGSTSAPVYVVSGGEAEPQGSFSELGHSGYVSESNEHIAVDNSLSLSMDGRMELDSNSAVSVSGYEDCSDRFLDCDLSSISNFDDPDGIFSDCTFWDGGISKMGGTLPETDDGHKDCPQPDNVINDVAPAKSFYSSLDGKSSRKRAHLEDDEGDVKSIPIKSGEVGQNKSNSLGGYTTLPECINQMQQSESQPSFAQSFKSVMHYKDRPSVESCNLPLRRGSVEDPCFFASGSSLPLDAAGDECQRFPTFHIDYQEPSKQPYMQNVGATPRKIKRLNPQEKIEKLKRRQQMLAMLAIEKQHREFNEQMNDVPGSRLGSACMDPLTRDRQESMSQISTVGHGSSITETTVSQLGSVIAKLDGNLKICMRDSLFRLAKSASMRMCSEDSSSMNMNGEYEDKVATNATDSSHVRFSNEQSCSEPATNQIDRIVALLLFNRHPENVSELINKMPSRSVAPQTSRHKLPHKLKLKLKVKAKGVQSVRVHRRDDYRVGFTASHLAAALERHIFLLKISFT